MNKTLTLKLKNNSIDTVCPKKDYKDTISEYIWNGFDAHASKIEINYELNELMGIKKITIKDNGDGINFENIENTFGTFLSSEKMNSLNPSEVIHGSKGKGRFAFTNISNLCQWNTTYQKNGKFYNYAINISNDNKNEFDVTERIETNNPCGTLVSIEAIKDLTKEDFELPGFKSYLINQYAWYLYLNKNKNFNIYINGEKLEYISLIDSELSEEKIFNIDDYVFKVNFICWKSKVSSKYYFYMLNDKKNLIYKKLTGFNNNAVEFVHSLYIESKYFNDFTFFNKDNELQTSIEDNNHTPNHETYKKLLKELHEFLETKYKKFIRKRGEKLINKFEEENIFPDMTGEPYAEYRKKDLKDVVQNIYMVQPKIFAKSSVEQSKSIVGFLNLLLNTNERQNIIIIIDSITELTPEERKDLANVLSKTTLNNIVRTIKMLEQREEVISNLKKLLYDNEKWTNERDHVQKIMEQNYWILGEQYNLITADKPFEKALSKYIYALYGEKKELQIENIQKKRRMDIFLAATRPVDTYSSSIVKEENIILELKAPYVTIDLDIYRQIEDYMRLIKNEPQFNSSSRVWKFYAISNRIDDYIKSMIDQNSKFGIPFLVNKIDNLEIYAMTWDDIFKNFEYKNKYLYDKLCLDKKIIEDEIQSENVDKERKLSDKLTSVILNLNPT